MKVNGGRLLIGAASVVMLAAIGAGLFVLGTPAHQRALRIDEQRTSSLRALSFAIGNYWSQHKTLPPDLHEVSQDAALAKDPMTGVPYAYVPGTANNYRLCAVFDSASETSPVQTAATTLARSRWDHPAGRQCFTFSATSSGIPEGDILPMEWNLSR
ncbi:hypothetical protein [Rhodanobacter sp. L36]|uniref:hypothetical protein n=1 Tax=Rhodanobacter sp. L36 TaxID=1747221 RepID=UPI00131CA62E|nr:hypothetical protein [Rhodanobacter sp. L36]